MASVTHTPFATGHVRNRANAPAVAPVEPSPRLMPFWTSLFDSAPAANDEPSLTKSRAIVGDLWIQIR